MDRFTATHHALLVAWISRAVVKATDETDGERIVRKAVRQYALQRGHRMALRAKANGHPLTMDNYVAYVEWTPDKGDMEQKIVEKTPDARIQVFKCPWHSAWEKNNLMEFGRYFCLEVDLALVEGFNKDLTLDIYGTRPNGAACCDMVFRGARLNLPNMLKLIYKKAINPGKRVIMGWEYHTGHLFKTMGEVIREELGDSADGIMDTAMADFVERFGEEAKRTVMSYQDTDFNRLPAD